MSELHDVLTATGALGLGNNKRTVSPARAVIVRPPVTTPPRASPSTCFRCDGNGHLAIVCPTLTASPGKLPTFISTPKPRAYPAPPNATILFVPGPEIDLIKNRKDRSVPVFFDVAKRIWWLPAGPVPHEFKRWVPEFPAPYFVPLKVSKADQPRAKAEGAVWHSQHGWIAPNGSDLVRLREWIHRAGTKFPEHAEQVRVSKRDAEAAGYDDDALRGPPKIVRFI